MPEENRKALSMSPPQTAITSSQYDALDTYISQPESSDPWILFQNRSKKANASWSFFSWGLLLAFSVAPISYMGRHSWVMGLYPSVAAIYPSVMAVYWLIFARKDGLWKRFQVIFAWTTANHHHPKKSDWRLKRPEHDAKLLARYTLWKIIHSLVILNRTWSSTQRPCLFYTTSLFVRVADDVDAFDPAVWGITMYHFVRGNSQDGTLCSRSLDTTPHLPGAAHKVLSSPPSKGFQQPLA